VDGAVTEQWMFENGLAHVGFPLSHQKCREALSMERFRAHYGVGPAALVAVHNDLRDGGVVFTTRDFFMSV
jgi:hypothetical protein